ncbi:MAG: acylphosphatase [Alphaproteobacteria bacterium GM7ARS4]|nr:acylphosphatase [Alphaproteobacteria bacterium GM7ARS4]
MRLVISGRVQGVCFRDWLTTKARAHALTGWVRNRSDGTVEAVLHGKQQAMCSLCLDAEEGPPLAKVKKVERFPYEGKDIGDSFIRKPDFQC